MPIAALSERPKRIIDDANFACAAQKLIAARQAV
jgi:hypothetical protein